MFGPASSLMPRSARAATLDGAFTAGVASGEPGPRLHRARAAAGRFPRAGEEYHYRFATAGADSPVGRFRTARPADSREPVRIAFFSCQEFIAGFYTAHADLAQQDVDLVVCLGDYIYEQAYADNTSRNAPVRSDTPPTARDAPAAERGVHAAELPRRCRRTGGHR